MLLFNKLLALFLIIISFSSLPLQAKEIHLTPDDDLQQALYNSQDGDEVILGSGNYLGNFIITKQQNY